jgi:hypothetical protein
MITVVYDDSGFVHNKKDKAVHSVQFSAELKYPSLISLSSKMQYAAQTMSSEYLIFVVIISFPVFNLKSATPVGVVRRVSATHRKLFPRAD